MSQTETKGLYLTMPEEWYNQIVALLQPMQTVQDFIRMAVNEKLQQLPKESKKP